MSERLTENHEKGEQQKNNAAELEKLAKAPEHDASKVEASVEHAKREEAQSEKKLEKLEREKEAEHERESHKAEKEQKPEAKPEPASKKERNQVFKKEISHIQSQLSPGSRAFSKVVHNRAVESASQVLEETVLRPSLILGGSIGALIIGIGIYTTAKIVGFPLSGSEFIIGVIIGGIIGVGIELIVYIFSKSKK